MSAKSTKKTGKTAKTVKVIKDEKGVVRKVIETTEAIETPKLIVTKPHTKPKTQHRPTLEEIKKAKEAEAKRLISRTDTMRTLAGIGYAASVKNNEFMADLFTLGLKKQLGNPELNMEIRELEHEQRETIDLVSKNPKYTKVQVKILYEVAEKLKKLKCKVYKKLKKKFGKKIAKIILCSISGSLNGIEVWDFEYPVGKKLKSKYEELDKIRAELEEEKKKMLAECPRIDPSDPSFADRSSISGKERVILPGDNLGKTNVDIRDYASMNNIEDLSIGSVDEVAEEKFDLLALAQKMP